MKTSTLLLLTAAAALIATAAPPPPNPALAAIAARGPAYTLFETGQVRPIALSADKHTLYVANTPNNRLEIFDLNDNGTPTPRASVTVGLEPVALAVRSANEVWVVNHLSDSISIVRIEGNRARVTRTLLVGDEPRDIVFAGTQRNRAFITTAHRGQNSPIDPQLTTPGIGRADVWVFDANNLGDNSLGGTPLTILTLFTDTPRALAVTPDGSRVYAAGFHTGNQTTSIGEGGVPDGGQANGGVPGPNTNYAGLPQPEQGIIVKFVNGHWIDQVGRPWDNAVKLNLPDKDVFVLNANSNPPAQMSAITGVGTILYNMIINPVSGKLYVSNTEARNDKRFEGPGTYAGETLRGHLHESRISVVTGSTVTPRHLNKHVNYNVCCALVPNPENAKSLAQPMDMAITADGVTLYVAAFGSSKVGIYQTSQLENDSFVPNAANQITVSGGGPSGLALDEKGKRLYVLTRFDNSISVINTASKTEINHVPMYSPEPATVTTGRRFLYDASKTSSHGDSSCGSCHVFGDFDSLAWNLGNPDGDAQPNPSLLQPFPIIAFSDTLHRPMKGPMVTQSLRGMDNHGPMHWRGDRTGVNDEPTAQPNSGQFNERLGFSKFNPAFQSLLGGATQLSSADMSAFTDFILQVTYPPNPIRNLDNSLTPDQAAGKNHFMTDQGFFQNSCNGCHVLDPDGNRQYGVARPGFFGTQGELVVETLDPLRPQPIKIPHLRNVYQKVGKFGQGLALPPFNGILGGEDTNFGDQIRGFGFLHGGGFDTVFRFMQSAAFSTIFSAHGFTNDPAGDVTRKQVEQFMMAFDSNMAPIVGQQITLNSSNWNATSARIQLLMNRCAAGECDLVVKTSLGDSETGLLYDNASGFIPDRKALPSVSLTALRALALASEVTFTAVPPGSGIRIALDCNLDGTFDGDERDRGNAPCPVRSHN